MIPSPSDLSYFLAVAELGSLSRAAYRLDISQPSLTSAMQRVEASVGTSLLIRHKRGVSLTKAGKQLQSHARQLMEQWETVKAAANASMNEIQGSFTIGCHPSVALYSLPHFLPQFMHKHTKINLRLCHDLSRHITEKIISLDIDIGIAVNPVRHPDLVIKKLSDDKITLWQGKENDHSRLPASDRVLICDPHLLQTRVILKKMKKQGMEFGRLLTSSSLEVIASLTEAGTGVGILPTKIARLHALTPVAKAPVYDDEICLLYHGQHREVKAIQAIAQAVKQAFQIK